MNQTGGVWPPWKLLALRIFNEHREAFDDVMKSLSPEQQRKLAEDVRPGFVMTGEQGLVHYPPAQGKDRDRLKDKVDALNDMQR